ncbi:diguanylate cyclase, partial [Paenibacillus sepulcri]|nr:diguanylate cyclase [Paenibacillus sepulcri]
MSINRAEKITLGTALAAVISFILIQLVHGELYYQIPDHLNLLVHSIMEFINFAISFTILVLGWLFFVKSLSRQRLFTGALFSIVGLFDMLHALTMEGMPFFHYVGDTTLSQIYAASAQLIGSVGLFVIFRCNDAPIPALIRRPVVFFMLGFGLLLAVLFYSFTKWTDIGMFSGTSLVVVQAMVGTVVFVAYSASIGMILYRNRNERPQALLTIIQSLVLLLFANQQFLLSKKHHDTDMLVGHIYKFAGYYYLLKGIYYVTIEEPFKEQERSEARINYLAYHDELTGLSNRRLLTERLNIEIERAQLSKNRLAILLLDIDRFKTINDALGHSFGDQMLQAVSE